MQEQTPAEILRDQIIKTLGENESKGDRPDIIETDTFGNGALADSVVQDLMREGLVTFRKRDAMFGGNALYMDLHLTRAGVAEWRSMTG